MTVLLVLVGVLLAGSRHVVASEQDNSRHAILPGVGVGAHTLGMSKDEVLSKSGEPETIFGGRERYALNNLPESYFMTFRDISFQITNDTVKGIGVHTPFYKFANGLGVGDSEQEIKQAFGNDFHLNDMGSIKDVLTYKHKGLMFEIRKMERTVMEIGIYQPSDDPDDSDTPDQREKLKHTIVPGVRVGAYTLDLSKNEILSKLGEPEAIQLGDDEVNVVRRGEEKYNLNNLPNHYILIFSNISFWMTDDSIEGISVQSPLYKLSNGVGVGDSEQKIKQAFGEDFQTEEVLGKDFTCYLAKGLAFAIHKKNQTVTEIAVYHPEGDDRDSDSSEHEADSTQTIVPGVGVGDYTLGMSKDDVLRSLGKPRNIHFAGENYTLDNLPKHYFMSYGDISFTINDGAVTGITAHNPSYEFANGLRVGNSEDKIKQAFGHDFEFEEFSGIDILTYENKGLHFEINKKDRTIKEIGINQVKRDQSDIPRVHRRDELGPYEDISGKDLRASDLRYSEDILDTLEFNQETQWPPSERLPEGFDPQALLQEGMNPGLGVRDLHARGITGAGVHVGLIDQPLLLDHPEYAGKIVSYHSDCGPHKSSMHGPAMASQLVGKRCGTAPGASLHVVAVPSWKADAGYYARALDRFVAYNENAPKEQKIRVVSVSCQPSDEGSVFKNQPLWDEAKGILVLDCTWHHGFVSLCWLDPEDRENVEACTPGFRLGEVEVDEGHIHVPSAPRTAAEADEDRSFGYAYDGGGRRSRRPKAKNGYSDTIPCAAGILALGWQIRPDLTPAQIKEMLFASAHVHESGARIIHPTAFIDLVRGQSSHSVSEGVCKEDSETLTIVPGVGVGDYALGMSKDDVLSKLGEPEAIQFGEDEVIRRGEKKYNLNDLPSEYILSFSDVSFWFEDNSVQVISVHSPLYKLGKGLGVGDSEQKIKQAFGEDFQIEQAMGKEFRCYHAKGIAFEIDGKNRTVAEIVVYRTEGDSGDPDMPDSAEAALVRKAASEGRIAYKLTTPDEFKALAGKPTREWTESDDEIIYLKYPGIQVRFFGKPEIQTPHTLVSISCEGRGIDIGRNRPIVLRNEGDLHKLGSFWGLSNIDLSRLDLSQQSEILKVMTFDSLTVWPQSDRLPPGFDPAKRLEWGKNPGLGVRSLHREGITGKGVGIAIIDQPLLRDHVEYADRIKLYHAIEVEGVDIQMHGPPVCSMAVGKTCGVAPQAILHYYAVPPWKWLENRPWARTVEQIVGRNRQLSPSEKVRVISISLGAFSRRDYYDQWQSAVKKAHQNGILVVTCDDRDFMPYVTLERLVGTDPENPNNYYFDSGVDALYVPASNRSMASHRGADVYTFDTHGGNSWTVPYLAGLAAMAFQIYPEISPERIVTLFQETATQTKRGRVINPRGFVEAVKRIKATQEKPKRKPSER
ncbi:MAG: hypothetical protein ISS70_13480 [Phycisphaerae bacterium]|nr:hypothetical protein [Phycisphaerae bacterium]